MAPIGFLKQLFGKAEPPGRPVAELARRLGIAEPDLRAIEPQYQEFTIPKRSGGRRTILSPSPALRAAQRLILRRLLSRLKAHPAATGFERGRSIVTNARVHARRAVVVKMDLKDFFASTAEKRVLAYFRRIGWGDEAARLLTRLCAHRGGLPAGAPTSPRLANLVNVRLDARLAAAAQARSAAYTRYADDLTFSFPEDDPRAVHALTRAVKLILKDEGYALHLRKKFHIRRRHDAQVVTGLVVNETVNLPRRTRRWLRAVEHRLATGRAATLTAAQAAGWRALAGMIARQR